VARSTGAWADVSSGRHEYLAPTPDPWPVPLAPNGKPLDGTAGTEPIPNPLSPTAATLARGRERFEIFCAPCHGPLGDGDGLVARRGFPHPPSYHTERLRRAADAHFYAVISHGYGAMYPYADRIPVSDRWAIVHYIRALQRSQNATLADVPPDARARLGAGK
jgi:mono/diheme cytochrome c family protein